MNPEQTPDRSKLSASVIEGETNPFGSVRVAPVVLQADHAYTALMSLIKGRFYRAANYLSIYVFILVVYGGAVLTDYLLFLLIWNLLSEDIQKYPVISSAFDYARIGLALLFIVAALIHGLISTYSQVKLDIKLSHEE